MTTPARPLRFFSFGAAVLLGLSLLGCEDKKTAQLPEWSPADHTNQGAETTGQVDTQKRRQGMEKLEARGINDVVLAAWKANCVTCHGTAGRGDGPQGSMARPPDMTDPGWQRTRVESEMKYAIQNGRGRMPAFSQLPDKTVDGLVQLVRMLNRDFKPEAPSRSPSP